MIKLRSAIVEDIMFRQSDVIDYRVLAANTHEAHAIPAGARWAVIHTSADCYVALGGTSFPVPSADVTNGTGPIYVRAGVPRLIDVQPQLHQPTPQIGMVSATAATVALEWFS